MTNETLIEPAAHALFKDHYGIDHDAQLHVPLCETRWWMYAEITLAALGLDDLPALAQRGATGLAEGPWSYEHEGVGHEPVKRDEIAHAVLSAAFSATDAKGSSDD